MGKKCPSRIRTQNLQNMSHLPYPLDQDSCSYVQRNKTLHKKWNARLPNDSKPLTYVT